jgi:hypothetical protein
MVSGQATWACLPYIAFNHLGQPEAGDDELVPLARGSVSFSLGADKVPIADAPTVSENPPGNSTNAFLVVRVDKLTGRARLEKQELVP